jgi:hypothetical protein
MSADLKRGVVDRDRSVYGVATGKAHGCSRLRNYLMKNLPAGFWASASNDGSKISYAVTLASVAAVILWKDESHAEATGSSTFNCETKYAC